MNACGRSQVSVASRLALGVSLLLVLAPAAAEPAVSGLGTVAGIILPFVAYCVARAVACAEALRRMMARSSAATPDAALDQRAQPASPATTAPASLQIRRIDFEQQVILGRQAAELEQWLRRPDLGLSWVVWGFAIAQSVQLWHAGANLTFELLLQVWSVPLVVLPLGRRCLAHGLPVAFPAGMAILMLALTLGAPSVSVTGRVVQAAGIAWLMGRLLLRSVRRRAHGHPVLAMLRVFGADASTAWLFGPLTRRWNQLGPSFTIADPSYIRQRMSIADPRLIRRLGLLALALGALLNGIAETLGALAATSESPLLQALSLLDPGGLRSLVASALWVSLMGLAVIPIMRAVRRSFIADRASAEARIDQALAQASSWRGRSAHVALFCQDDVWKFAVDRMLERADAVVMDLRGFSPARVGCEYEVRRLIDQVAIDRILVLVDSGPNGRAVEALWQSQWPTMAADSPNRRLDQPTLLVYAAAPFDNRDLPRVTAILLDIAVARRQGTQRSAEFRPTPVGAEVREALRTLISGAAQLAEWLMKLLDMVFARADIARWVLPPLVLYAVCVMSGEVLQLTRWGAQLDMSGSPSTLMLGVQEGDASRVEPCPQQGVACVGVLQEVRMPELSQELAVAEGGRDQVWHVALPASMPMARGLLLLRSDGARLRLHGVDCNKNWVRAAGDTAWSKACELIRLPRGSLTSGATAFELLAAETAAVPPDAPP